MKNARFLARLGYALAGIAIVWKREKSFRTQCALAGASLGVAALIRPGPGWTALILLAIALVLALEMANAALEYLIDLIHPGLADEIKFAKDAAAGAVLVASIASLAIGGLMLLDLWMG